MMLMLKNRKSKIPVKIIKRRAGVPRARLFRGQPPKLKRYELSLHGLTINNLANFKWYQRGKNISLILKQKLLLDKWRFKMTMGQGQGLQALLVILALHKNLPKYIVMNPKDSVLGSDKLTNSHIMNQISPSKLSKGIKVPNFFIGDQYNRGERCSLREYKVFLDRIIANKGEVRVYHHQFSSRGRLNIKNIKKESLQNLYSSENKGQPSGVLSAVGYFLERKFIVLKHLKHKRMMLLGFGPRHTNNLSH
jgi:hypothetical protein